MHMNKKVFKMPVPVKINGRISSITNSFFNGIIPVIEPSDEEIMEALAVLGMDEDTICCAYCGDRYTEWDHLNPLIKDRRPTGYVSEIHNLVPACGKCNQSKGNKPWKQWILSDALQSPATRRIPDLNERIAKIEEYEKNFLPINIDIESIVGEERWKRHLNNLDRLCSLMNECQEHSDEIRSIISSRFESDRARRNNKRNRIDQFDVQDNYPDKKIGEIAQTVLRSLLETGAISDEEITSLQDRTYSKDVLNLNYPLLVKHEGNYDKRRYYSKPITICGEKYLMCSQWVDGNNNSNRPFLLKWILDHQE